MYLCKKENEKKDHFPLLLYKLPDYTVQLETITALMRKMCSQLNINCFGHYYCKNK